MSKKRKLTTTSTIAVTCGGCHDDDDDDETSPRISKICNDSSVSLDTTDDPSSLLSSSSSSSSSSLLMISSGSNDDNNDKHRHHSSASTLRRSARDIHRLHLCDRTSLQHRRLSELFFRDDTDDDNDKNKKDEHAESILLPRSTTTTVTFKIAGLELQRIHASPHIYVIEHFLKDTEIAYFADKIIRYAKFQKSFVDQDHHHTKDHNIQTTTTSSRYDENRTSSFVSFPKQHDKTIHTIEQRAANILGCYSTHTIEPIQLVRYQKHQFFGTHHDLGMYDENERTVLIPPKSILSPRRRLVTFFVYLNSVERGGATYFPIPNVRIQPIPGRAVLFSNVLDNAQPDPRTIHAGEIVQEGIKYGLNIWICEE